MGVPGPVAKTPRCACSPRCPPPRPPVGTYLGLSGTSSHHPWNTSLGTSLDTPWAPPWISLGTPTQGLYGEIPAYKP